MRKIILSILLIILSIGGFFLLKQYNENQKIKQLTYNESILIKTLKNQKKYVLEKNNCPKEIAQTIINLRKHLKLTQDKLKMKTNKVENFKIDPQINLICNINQ